MGGRAPFASTYPRRSATSNCAARPEFGHGITAVFGPSGSGKTTPSQLRGGSRQARPRGDRGAGSDRLLLLAEGGNSTRKEGSRLCLPGLGPVPPPERRGQHPLRAQAHAGGQARRVHGEGRRPAPATGADGPGRLRALRGRAPAGRVGQGPGRVRPGCCC